MKKTLLISGLVLSNLIYAQQATSLAVPDTRDINSLPSAYTQIAKVEFKFRDVVQVPGVGNYSAMFTIAPWVDSSGNKVHQLNFNDGGVFYRNASQADSQWGSWNQLLMADVNGDVKFNDFISGGVNSWIFHTPDDTRRTLHIAPRNTANTDWDWQKSFVINGANGNALLNGKFEAKEVKVTATPTADFVFDEDYKLPQLDEVEKHIKEKKHLPEIASAAQMEKEGVNIGEFQIKLLQKIEELTLYTIEQNKQLKKLQENNDKLAEEIKELKAVTK
ncbi:cell wall anchor protein [Chryseobacterium oranimense]|uniref:cell wall anchor protein n=1 Tax=Chryseobacterium oranimense TaxID=421058 RepID=UPI0021AF3878|nr:cell wall anchor protein [Chryseobacterium oranimense]UWX59239.1 cell wall anchor protein [Chryseobacterium oranimense]